MEFKEAASAAIMKAGVTITHHHAVGRMHRPWYDQQRPDLFAVMIRAAKNAVEPNGIMNPGVLIDLSVMATPSRFELPIFAVTGRRVNRYTTGPLSLNY